ncbi:hypothetical protein ABPG74_006581 [Tetrahymena malaccensis]
MLQKNQEAVQTFVQTERLDSGVMPSNQLNVLQDNVNFIQSQNLFTEQEILEKNNTRLNAKESQETEICVEGDQKNTERQFTSIESIRQNNKQGQSWKEFNFNMNTNWFQRIFFVDLLRLLFHCKKSVKSKTEMHLNDIPHLFPDEQICQIGKRFEIYTENEKNRLNKKGREIGALSMLKIFVLTYKHQFFMEFFYIFLLNAFKIASTICIANLINDIANSEPKQKQYMWASIIAVSNFLQVLCLHHSNKINYTLFSSIRVMFMKTLYQKISNLSAHTIKETNVGKLVNIVSSDLTTIEIKSFLIISLTMIPFGLIAVAAVLYFRFGSFGVLGLLLMTCFIPIQIFAAEKSSKIFAQKTSLIDKRINLTSELIEGIRLIKMYAWEGAFKKAIVEVRNLELKKVFKILLYFVFEHSLSQATGILVTYFILALIQGFGDTNQLTIGSMFATLDLLQYTRSKMISVAGYGLSGALELKVVFQRMANVLKIKQTQMSSIDGENEYQKETTQKGELILNHFSAYWRGDQAVLKDINLHIKQGECVSIVGKIGSGKSTLLNCFLQEVPKFKGNFSYNGKLAYVEQEPYIFNCSVRENIIFESQYTQESSENITVSLQTYWKYISSSKYLLIIPILIILFFTSEVLTTVFTNAIGQYGSESYSKQSIVNFLGFLTLAYTINLIIKYYMLIKVESSSSQNLHDKMIESLVKSKVEYFEKTQSGRILNRYSTDLVIVDQSLPLTSIDSLEVLCSHVVMLIMLIVINPYFLIVAFIMILMLYYFLVISKICLIQSKQTDLRNRSPVFNYFTATMQGILPLRVYGQTKQFQEKFNQLSDSSLRSSYCYWHITRAFGAYVHIFSSLAGIIGIYMLIFIGKSGSQVGQSIVYFLSMSDIIQWGLRQIIQTDVTMSSTQRILNMCQLESESDLITAYDQKFLKNNLITKQTDQGVVLQEQKFPQEGKVEFINVRMRYRKGQDPILNQLSFTINPGMRVGCVGRTGAGKSSLIAALFRMTEIDEPENQNEEIAIKLDGHIAKQLGLHTLRSGISLIPQIPFIFSGTILRNIDPLGEYTENEIKKVIDDVGLQDKIEELPNGLDTDMTNASEIFSVGQKQLICLARAILKKSKLLILDEATANVDMITDDLIQRKIKERFQGSTVITVAHRLNTIADYDMVIVMDKGRVIEQGDPYDLLSKEQSHFKDMVNQTGKNNSKNIYDIAKQAHLLRKNQELYF